MARGRSVSLKGTREFTRSGMIHCWVNAIMKCVRNITYTHKMLQAFRLFFLKFGRTSQILRIRNNFLTLQVFG